MTSLSPHSVNVAPQIGATSSYQKRTVRLEIEGGEERLWRGYGKQEFRPEVVVLEWANRDDSPDWQLTRAEVIGTVWKQDGSTGMVQGRRDFAGQIADAPKWLIDAVLLYGPFAPSSAVSE